MARQTDLHRSTFKRRLEALRTTLRETRHVYCDVPVNMSRLTAQDRVLATMNVIYLQRAVEESGSIDKIAAALQEAARTIEEKFAAQPAVA